MGLGLGASGRIRAGAVTGTARRPWLLRVSRRVRPGPLVRQGVGQGVVARRRQTFRTAVDRVAGLVDRVAGLAGGRVGDQSERPGRRGGEQPPGVDGQDRRPEVLARRSGRAEVRARAGRDQLDPAEPDPYLVLLRAADLGDDLARRRRRDRDSTLGEVRLAAGTHGVAELSGHFLGDPHHPFPSGTAAESDARGTTPGVTSSSLGRPDRVSPRGRLDDRELRPSTVIVAKCANSGPVTPAPSGFSPEGSVVDPRSHSTDSTDSISNKKTNLSEGGPPNANRSLRSVLRAGRMQCRLNFPTRGVGRASGEPHQSDATMSWWGSPRLDPPYTDVRDCVRMPR